MPNCEVNYAKTHMYFKDINLRWTEKMRKYIRGST